MEVYDSYCLQFQKMFTQQKSFKYQRQRHCKTHKFWLVEVMAERFLWWTNRRVDIGL